MWSVQFIKFLVISYSFKQIKGYLLCPKLYHSIFLPYFLFYCALITGFYTLSVIHVFISVFVVYLKMLLVTQVIAYRPTSEWLGDNEY
jgi:hypothetical protein